MWDNFRLGAWLLLCAGAIALLQVSSGHGQPLPAPDPAPPLSVPAPPGPALPTPDPVVTRAGIHDDFARIVFDWPQAVGYETTKEGTTLTVMFARPLETHFEQVYRHLEDYVSGVTFAPDQRSLVFALTRDYRLRTFPLHDPDAPGPTKIVIDLLGPETPDASPTDTPLSPAMEALILSQVVGGEGVGGEAVEVVEAAEAIDAIDSTDPIDAIDSIDATDPSTPGLPFAATPVPSPSTEGTEAAVATDSTDVADAPGPTAAPDPSPQPSPPRGEGAEEDAPEVMDVTEAIDATDATDLTDLTDPIDATDPIDPTDSTDPTDSIDPTDPPASLLTIPIAQSRMLSLEGSAASVFVANPDIADVQLVSSSVLLVIAKAVGRTSVAALDADSELLAEWTVATVVDVEPARAALAGAETLANVSVRQLSRGVELSGLVSSVADADLALRLATAALPDGLPIANRINIASTQQVNLEVQIAEVQRSVSETLGFNWEVLPDIGGGRGLGFRVGRFFFDEATGSFISQALPGGLAASLSGNTGVSPGRTTVRGMIDALATAGLATVLARPNVTTISGQTASFFSGGEYPLPAGYEDGAIIFEYKKYGVLLDFVPTVVDNRRIVLTVRPEVSQRSETDSLTVTGLDIPVINVRRAETTVEVGDGESIVIAGLYRDQSEAIESGLPVLKDVPLVNLLFGTRTVRSSATELIVVVTARLTSPIPRQPTLNRPQYEPGRRLRGYHY